MDTTFAFLMAQINRGKELMVFDWDKAARIIKERGATHASAGLSGDWEWTGGDILRDGRMLTREETYTYLCSNWATPQLDIEGDVIDCYVMQSERPEQQSDTMWPESARKIMEEE